ncbi:MAG: alpha/beta fold hydrolase [Acidimicrobiales bacterium]
MSAGARLPGTPDPAHRWTGSGGVTITGDSWGDAGAPLVLLQHGGGQTRHAWRRAGELLAHEGYHAVAIDARGHGDSDWAPDGDYERTAMVADVAAVVDALGGGPVALVGASMGGNTSLAAAGERAVDATALVLVDIAPRIRPSGTKRVGEFMEQRPEGFDTLEEVADAIASYQPHRERPDTLDGLAKNVRQGEDGRYRWHWDPAMRKRPRLSGDALRARTRRLEDAARALTIPTLLVRGGLSDVLDEAGARKFLDLVAHAEYVNITGAGHMVAGDRNDVFTQAVVDFLKRSVPV